MRTVPAITFKTRSHAVGHNSVPCTLDLLRALCNLIQEQVPLLNSRGGGSVMDIGMDPIDAYNHFKKNCESAHSHLDPVGAIWLRLIMTCCVYNAYHTHNLSQTVSYHLSERCKSFKDFQKMHACQLTFRQFCLEVAHDLKIQVVPPTMHERGSDVDDTRMWSSTDGGHRTSSVDITYNKREACFSKPHLIERRMNLRVRHQPSSAQTQSRCVWRCCIDHATGEIHNQQGRKTT